MSNQANNRMPWIALALLLVLVPLAASANSVDANYLLPSKVNVQWISLVLTIILEVPIVWLIVRKRFWTTALNGLLINGLTQPLALLAFWSFSKDQPTTWPIWLFVEIAVILVEWPLIVWLFKAKGRRALIAAVAANAASALIGGFLVSVHIAKYWS